jgi:phospholipid/cholesterol/gamma-HCH transport system substrate-binding protein
VRNVSVIGRVAAIAAVAIAGAAVALIVLRSGGENYRVKALFQNSSQLVKGNLVQLSGTPVGKVEEIALTDDGRAQLTLKIDDDHAPLRHGTKATVRAASLSGVANRYIDLRLPPGSSRPIANGGVLPQENTESAVDLDQLFNVFGKREREALSQLIRGFGEQHRGYGKEMNAGLVYLNPSLVATSRLFAEVNHDEDATRRFVRESAALVSDISERRSDLAGLVDHLATTTGAIGRQDDALAESISRLPAFMRRANTTFVNLRATLDDLEPLVDESKPVAKKLRPFFAELRPLARNARPTINDLSNLVNQSGASNDLIELTQSNVPVRDIAVRDVERNGKDRQGAFPATIDALRGATPELAYARPYAVDLTGWFDDFSHSGVYDALGGVSRVAINANIFTLANSVPTGNIIPAPLRAQLFQRVATIGQNNRCPGSSERSLDGSNPWKPYPDYPCDEKQRPPDG